MQRIFIGHLLNIMFKGKQKPVQVVIASFFLLLALLCIKPVINYLSGGLFGPGDFFGSVFFLYGTCNFCVVMFANEYVKEEKKQAQAKAETEPNPKEKNKATQNKAEQETASASAGGSSLGQNIVEQGEGVEPKVKPFIKPIPGHGDDPLISMHYSKNQAKRTEPKKSNQQTTAQQPSLQKKEAIDNEIKNNVPLTEDELNLQPNIHDPEMDNRLAQEYNGEHYSLEETDLQEPSFDFGEPPEFPDIDETLHNDDINDVVMPLSTKKFPAELTGNYDVEEETEYVSTKSNNPFNKS